jgi:phage anti-repressor protein
MKVTEFLKKYSLINGDFIDDFYSFYDNNQNEYDYTIDLNKLAFWLEIRKGHLKDLLVSNFAENEDYIIEKNKSDGKGKGKGKNNVKVVMLTYACAKTLCMISRAQKAAIIRNFYIDLEKLIITYKDSIVRDLNNQLGIKLSNKELIEKNKNKGLIYVLKIDDDTNLENYKETDVIQTKLGNSEELKKRMKQYNVGSINELPIVFVYLTDDYVELEKCLKDCLRRYQIKAGQEKYLIDLAFIKETIKYCTIRKAILIKQNKKLLNKKDDRKFLIILDNQNLKHADELVSGTKNTSVVSNEKSNSKKTSKKFSKKPSKKPSKKSIKGTSKKLTIKKSIKGTNKKLNSKKPIKKPSKKSINRTSKKPSKKSNSKKSTI